MVKVKGEAAREICLSRSRSSFRPNAIRRAELAYASNQVRSSCFIIIITSPSLLFPLPLFHFDATAKTTFLTLLKRHYILLNFICAAGFRL